MRSERTGTVLNILVDEYINTATPVASEDIARLCPDKVSPATVRSTMSQLTDEGYISRPHVSAGAVPSDRGYRYYVESFKKPPELSASIRQRIRQHFGQVDPDVEVWSQQCAAVLSTMTASMAIVTVPRASSLRFKHIQLVYLQDFLVLMVIVLQEARLLRRILPLEVSATQLQLTQAADELNESLGGLNFSEIEARNMENSLLGELVKKNTVGMLREAETTVALEHHVDGLRLLLSQPEFSRGDQAKDLVEMVEEKVLLESVLSMVPRTGEVAVFIGEENLAEALRPFGVILCQYGIPQQVSGTICVIGPTRMSYAGAISGVRFLSSFMSGLVLELHGG